MYTTRLTVALTGATDAQLSWWRKVNADGAVIDDGADIDDAGVFLAPSAFRGGKYLYSYQDVQALRILVRLRQQYSLQQLRKIVTYLKVEFPESPISALSFAPVSKSSLLLFEGNDVVELMGVPGQLGFAREVMASVDDAYVINGRQIPNLKQPFDGVSINDKIREGYPVISGTRIPFDAVAALVSDGYGPDEIRTFYSGVSDSGVEGAVNMDACVRAFEKHAA